MKKYKKSRTYVYVSYLKLKKKHHVDYTTLRNELKWLDMNSRRLKHGLTLIYKILHNLAPNYLHDTFTLVNEIHNVNTRHSNSNIWIPKTITSKIHRNAYTFEMAKIYNQIPENIKNSISVNSFKCVLVSLSWGSIRV